MCEQEAIKIKAKKGTIFQCEGKYYVESLLVLQVSKWVIQLIKYGLWYGKKT